jgi:hypothetical protein
MGTGAVLQQKKKAVGTGWNHFVFSLAGGYVFIQTRNIHKLDQWLIFLAYDQAKLRQKIHLYLFMYIYIYIYTYMYLY